MVIESAGTRVQGLFPGPASAFLLLPKCYPFVHDASLWRPLMHSDHPLFGPRSTLHTASLTLSSSVAVLKLPALVSLYLGSAFWVEG